MTEETLIDTKPKMARPKVPSESQKELDKVEAQFEQFNEQVQSMTMDRMNQVPKPEQEMQIPMSKKEVQQSKDIYLKPIKSISCREKFNEKYRDDYNFAKEYVNFIAENKEIIGESLDIWTRPFAGMPAEEWLVPVNKPLWGPRYLAEQIKRKYYHRLKMDESKTTSSDGTATYYGQMTVDTVVPRLDAHPVNKQKSIFMGGNTF